METLFWLGKKLLWVYLVVATWAATLIRPRDRFAAEWLLHYLLGSGVDKALPKELYPEMGEVLRRAYLDGRGAPGVLHVLSSDYYRRAYEDDSSCYMEVAPVSYKMVGGFTASYRKVKRTLKVDASDIYDWHQQPGQPSAAEMMMEVGHNNVCLHPLLHKESWYTFDVPWFFALPLAFFGLAWHLKGHGWLASEAIFSLAGGKSFTTRWHQRVRVKSYQW